eukprot:scaffold33437_cov68-Attheya_sp.AAC.1
MLWPRDQCPRVVHCTVRVSNTCLKVDTSWTTPGQCFGHANPIPNGPGLVAGGLFELHFNASNGSIHHSHWWDFGFLFDLFDHQDFDEFGFQGLGGQAVHQGKV